MGQGPTFFQGTLGNVQSKDLKNCPRNSSEAKSSEDSFWGPRTGHSPEVPRKTVGPYHYTLVMPVWYFYSCKRLFHKTWDIWSTVFLCPPPFFAINVGHWEYWFSMSHVFRNWGGHWKKVLPMSRVFLQTGGTIKNSLPNVTRFMKNPGKCPILLLRVKLEKPGYNENCAQNTEQSQ